MGSAIIKVANALVKAHYSKLKLGFKAFVCLSAIAWRCLPPFFLHLSRRTDAMRYFPPSGHLSSSDFCALFRPLSLSLFFQRR
uniref:Uncharacterized protein n=1 Tax=Globodera rostochiensis TaxID=31243 RepID=A0A914I3H9_GLORO